MTTRRLIYWSGTCRDASRRAQLARALEHGVRDAPSPGLSTVEVCRDVKRSVEGAVLIGAHASSPFQRDPREADYYHLVSCVQLEGLELSMRGAQVADVRRLSFVFATSPTHPLLENRLVHAEFGKRLREQPSRLLSRADCYLSLPHLAVSVDEVQAVMQILMWVRRNYVPDLRVRMKETESQPPIAVSAVDRVRARFARGRFESGQALDGGR